MRLLKVVIVIGMAISIAMPQTGDNTNVGNIAAWTWDPGASDTTIQLGSVRGVIAGTDVDNDGKTEIWSSHYSGGGGVAGFEMLNDSTLEMIFIDSSGSNRYDGTRWVQIGDLDGDGLKEVIFFAGRETAAIVGGEETGLYIYECTGDNTFADPVFTHANSLGFLFNGMANLTYLRVENFLVDDVDGDGNEELVFASNGGSFITDYLDTVITPGVDTTVYTYGHSEDFFGVLYATGDLQSGWGAIEAEFATSARDIDMGTVDTSSAMFGRDNRLGGGSATCVGIADTDGDDLKELILHSWNSFNTAIVEVTGADTYSFGSDTTCYVQFTSDDDVCLKNMSVVDVDGDGKDEVFLANYGGGSVGSNDGFVYMIKDVDDDATHFVDTTETSIVYDDTLNASFGSIAGDIDGDGLPDIYVATSGVNNDIINLEYDGGTWNWYPLLTDSIAHSATGDFAITIAVADLDGDGHEELITGHQGVPDSVTVIDTTVTPHDTSTVPNPRAWTIRVTEWDPISGPVAIKDMRIITPDNYKLGMAYPNPFNPTTTIEYTLPLRKEISLIVYNLLGKEVVRLVDREVKEAGAYQVVWNGKDARGIEVASGAYLYVLKFGNFQKSHRVTFLK